MFEVSKTVDDDKGYVTTCLRIEHIATRDTFMDGSTPDPGTNSNPSHTELLY